MRSFNAACSLARSVKLPIVHDRRGSNRRSLLCYQESSRGVVLAGTYLAQLSQHQIGNLVAIELLKLASQYRFTRLEGL